MKNFRTYIFWGLRILAALIMLQTLFFKFSASPESVYIFSKIGMEPWGRIGIGILELVASILLFVPGLIWLGALLGMQLMAGAIFFHLTKLSISIMGDGGYLFCLAVTVMVSCGAIAWMEKERIISVVRNFYSTYLKRNNT